MLHFEKAVRCAAASAIACLTLAMAHPAAAQSSTPGIDLSAGPDAAVIAGSLLGTLALQQMPIARRRWSSEPFPFDESFRGTFSKTHDTISDVLIMTTIGTPILAGALRDDPDLLPKVVVIGETLSVGLLLNAVAKFTVQRPRPYSYGTDIGAVDCTRAHGNDAYLSFFSSHSTTAFAAGVSGSLLFAYGNPDTETRAVVWGLEMAFASATATERVRAGHHFPSDIILGAAVGTGIGILVPRAHMRDRSAVAIQPVEWAAIGGGLLVGTSISAALPRFHWPRYESQGMTFRLIPSISTTTAGLEARGVF